MISFLLIAGILLFSIYSFYINTWPFIRKNKEQLPIENHEVAKPKINKPATKLKKSK